MKILYYLKRNILLICGFIIIIISMIYINNYFVEKAFIKECIELCYKDIYNYMAQEDSKIYFGHYEVCFGVEKRSLASIFYTDFIINDNYIIKFVEGLNWQEIITINNGNITNIITFVRQEYITYIKIQEIDFTFNLLQNTNIEEIKQNSTIFLQNYIKESKLAALLGKDHLLDTFITNIIENVNWDLYIRTIEFQNKQFTTLIEILHDKIQNLWLLKAQEEKFKFDNILKRRLFIRNFMDYISSTFAYYTIQYFVLNFKLYSQNVIGNSSKHIDYFKVILDIFKSIYKYFK